MSHADVEVKWIPWKQRWLVLRKTNGKRYKQISKHRKKAPAKDNAKRMAKDEGLYYAAYSKDKNPRITEQKDYR